MIGYINKNIKLLAKFPSAMASPDTIGFTLLDVDGTILRAREEVLTEVGNGAFATDFVSAVELSCIVFWDCTKGTDTRYVYEDLSIIAGAEVTVDLTPVTGLLTDPIIGLEALSQSLDGLATEATQLDILNLLTIPGYVGPVIPVPAPAVAGLQVLYGAVLAPNGVTREGVIVSALLKGANHISNNFLVQQRLIDTTDVNGVFNLVLVQGAKYEIVIPEHGKTYLIIVSDALTEELNAYVGGA